MAFTRLPTRTFAFPNAIEHAPQNSGVFGIFDLDDQCIIIESTNNLRRALERCANRNHRISEHRPHWFTYELTGEFSNDKESRARTLTGPYNPSCSPDDTQPHRNSP